MIQAEPYISIMPGCAASESGVTSPELLIMFPYGYLEISKECTSFITLGKLFQILGALMKKECLNISVLADFNINFCWRQECVSQLFQGIRFL